MKDLFGNEVIRTLGFYQPFASLMLHNKIETRFVRNGRKAPFPPGKYLIYSTQRHYDTFGDGLNEICTEEQIKLIRTLMWSEKSFFSPGAIAIADLTKIIDPVLPDTPNTFVKYVAPDTYYRRVGLVFENVQRINPFTFKGKQGVGILTSEQKRLIELV